MPLRASSHPGSPNSPSCSALAWYSCWPGLSPWGESWKQTQVARTAALTRYRYATQPLLIICEGNLLVIGGYPLQSASNSELSCFLSIQLGQAIEQTAELTVTSDAMPPMSHHCNENDRVPVSICGLTHCGPVNYTIIGLDDGLLPGQCQAIIWTNGWILLIEPLETKFSEIFIKIHQFSFKNMHLKLSYVKWQPFCFSLNELTHCGQVILCSMLDLCQHCDR